MPTRRAARRHDASNGRRMTTRSMSGYFAKENPDLKFKVTKKKQDATKAKKTRRAKSARVSSVDDVQIKKEHDSKKPSSNKSNDASTQLTKSANRPLSPHYEYSAVAIPGVTSTSIPFDPPTPASKHLHRLIRSEYVLPVAKFVEPEPNGESKSNGEMETDGGSRVDAVVLIQSRLSHSLYALVVQAVLWNQTSGRQARPVLNELLHTYPDPATLAATPVDELAEMLRPIGLFNSRARRLTDMARVWCAQPPLPGRGYVRARDRKYVDVPVVMDMDGTDELEESDVKFEEGGATVKDEQADAACEMGKIKSEPELSEELRQAYDTSSEQFWEIAHLPGVGPYALDSFRIFHRDEMRGLARDWLGTGAGKGFEPEWKRVVPGDKDLRAYLKYLWALEGWSWDPLTGKKKRL